MSKKSKYRFIKNNSKPQASAKVKALVELGFNNTQIRKRLKIGKAMYDTLINTDLPAEWEDYKKAVKRVFFETDTTIAELTAYRIREMLVTKEHRLADLTALYKTTRELQDDTKPTIQLNTQNNYSGLSDEQIEKMLKS